MILKNSQKEAPYLLIVDDDDDDQHFLTSAILDIIPGATVKSLYDGSDAIALLKHDPTATNAPNLPDLIFLDINMNRLCGRKTTELLKKDKHVQHIPIVILTTASSADQKKELISAGADDFYTKPHNIHELKAIVQEIRQKWL